MDRYHRLQESDRFIAAPQFAEQYAMIEIFLGRMLEQGFCFAPAYRSRQEPELKT